MAPALLDTLEASLDALDVTHGRTTAAELPDAVRDAVVEPAVGASLPWDGLSLGGTPVDLEPTPAALQAAATGVTAAGAAIAAEGSLLIQGRPAGDEPTSLYPPRHVAVLRERDVLEGVAEAVEWLAGEFGAGRRSAVIATGASATADMGELVAGVHGPGEVHVITVTDR
ncbi:MAG: LUD domain-containing protein [Halobacteriales archaeon]